MPIRYIFGEAELSCDKARLCEAMDALSKIDVPFRNMKNGEDRLSFFVPLYRRKSTERTLSKRGIDTVRGKIIGFPALLLKYKKRWGLIVGSIVCVLMLYFSQRVIWCVNVSGNESVPSSQIIALLEKLGCGVGDTWEDIDFDSLHNRFLIESKDIAWIAVNMNGTHANVQVREIKKAEENEEEGFYNIVAAEDGQIERVAAKEGKSVVKINDTVKKGELLISGAISYKDTHNRFESADGAVYARVYREFEVNVPLNQSIKQETGRKIEEKSLRFFKFNINLFVKGGKEYEFCDTITVCDQVYLFDTVPLPLWISSTEHTEYEMQCQKISAEEARLIAIGQYRERLAEVLGEGSLISRELSESFDSEEEIYTIKCRLYCIDDIAKKVPLIIEKENKNEETESHAEKSQYSE